LPFLLHLFLGKQFSNIVYSPLIVYSSELFLFANSLPNWYKSWRFIIFVFCFGASFQLVYNLFVEEDQLLNNERKALDYQMRIVYSDKEKNTSLMTPKNLI
jgi:hypothetical protein